MIRTSGRACHLVRDGREAIGHAESSNVLIFDLKLPLIQGVEVYSRLREAGRSRPTIIVTASGSGYHDTLEAMRDVAITGILNKPFDPMSLLNRLECLVA